MVSESTSKEMTEGPPPLDESWWAALLEDEEKSWALVTNDSSYAAELKKDTRTVSIDWDYAKKIYAKDDLVELRVTGYNRGGLLVEGDALQGFVPVSHLVNLPDMETNDDREQLLADYIGRSMQLKVIECDRERGRARVLRASRAGCPNGRSDDPRRLGSIRPHA